MTDVTSLPARTEPSFAAPFAALLLGALAMGISPVFVRFADVGPFASAFWRVAAALPLLWAWAAWEARRSGEPHAAVFRFNRPILLTGLTFSVDLLFWHLAILKTTIANATFLATMAPVWVILFSGLFIGERVRRNEINGLALCLLGAVALIGISYSARPHHVTGDLLGVATSLFFGLYFLAVRVARRTSGSGRIIFLSSILTSLVLLAATLLFEGRLLPHSLRGVGAILGLSVISHTGGQGLLAYALGFLPASFSSLVIFIESLAAALFGWLLLDEPVSLLQALGGALILAGLFVASPRRAKS
jgi:drug/metabolite transporter (DMT)-like permease